MPNQFSAPQGLPKEAQIQRLSQKTACAPLLCRQALVDSKGSLLSALLLLEEQGHVLPPTHQNQGRFSTKDKAFVPESPVDLPLEEAEHSWSWGGFLRTFQSELLHNHFELWYGEQYLKKIPVIVLLVLFPLSYGSLAIFVTVPLFFGIHYRFSAEGSFLSEFNPIILRISKSLSELRSILKPKSKK